MCFKKIKEVLKKILRKESKSVIILPNSTLNKKIDHNKIQIAVVTPSQKGDYLANTIIDGLSVLETEGKVNFYVTSNYPITSLNKVKTLSDDDFVSYAKEADIILFEKSGEFRDRNLLVDKINRYEKVIYIDGSELKHNNRYDQEMQKKILLGEYSGIGSIDEEMLKKCALYFRREKPYIKGIKPFPFGIERRYCSEYRGDIVKDIDFVCIFGQETFPPLRKYCREILERFCKENNFSCITKRTEGFSFEDSRIAGRKEFFGLLARSKVGISVGGGGYDTARFWETLANNCILLTEKIDIYEPGSNRLNYDRIWQFNNLFDFEYQLRKLGDFLRNDYRQEDMTEEYNKIMHEHSSVSRVLEIIEAAKNKGMLKNE